MTTRTRPKLVIGVPTIPRPRDYLHATLDSLVAGIPADAWDKVEIVVLNAAVPPERHAAARALSGRYPELVASGRLTLLENPNGHTESDRGAEEGAGGRAEGETEARFHWRKKLVLDFAHLGQHCAARGDLYLHVEDDMLAAPSFLVELRAWFDGHFAGRDDWAFLSFFTTLRLPDGAEVPPEEFFSACALLFRSDDLRTLVDYATIHHRDRELDFLIRDWAVGTGRKIFARSPALFQHIGLLSSFGGETRPMQSASFREDLHPALRRGVRDLLDQLRHRPSELSDLFRWRSAVLIPPLLPLIRWMRSLPRRLRRQRWALPSPLVPRVGGGEVRRQQEEGTRAAEEGR